METLCNLGADDAVTHCWSMELQKMQCDLQGLNWMHLAVDSCG